MVQPPSRCLTKRRISGGIALAPSDVMTGHGQETPPRSPDQHRMPPAGKWRLSVRRIGPQPLSPAWVGGADAWRRPPTLGRCVPKRRDDPAPIPVASGLRPVDPMIIKHMKDLRLPQARNRYLLFQRQEFLLQNVYRSIKQGHRYSNNLSTRCDEKPSATQRNQRNLWCLSGDTPPLVVVAVARLLILLDPQLTVIHLRR